MNLETIRQTFDELNLDALLVTEPTNRRYFSGFTGSAGSLLITKSQAFLITDFRYYEQACKEAPDFELIKQDTILSELLPYVFKQYHIKRLGIESEHITLATYEDLFSTMQDITIIPTRDVLTNLRALKSDRDLALLQKAIDITDEAYTYAETYIKPGLSEKEVASELQQFVQERGADRMGFIIVSGGANGAMPHASPTDRLFKNGDAVVLDMGAQVEGYTADLTRSFVLGTPSDFYTTIYELVLSAQEAAITQIKPGMTGKQADALSRKIISDAGYEEAFGHGLGHGVGFLGLNKPFLSHRRAESEELLLPGMVFTIEPGIYLPNQFGVRIEDIVLLTEQGCRCLSHAAKKIAINP